jgi:hypothetical protein
MTCTLFTATAATSPAMVQRAWISGPDTWRAAVDGALGYWQGGWHRGITPFRVGGDLSRWWGETSNRCARVGDAEARGARVPTRPAA